MQNTFPDTFPACFKERAKRQHRDGHITIDYKKVIKVGEYDGIFGYGTKARGELLVVEYNGKMYPCYRKKSDREGVITAICQDRSVKACTVEEWKASLK